VSLALHHVAHGGAPGPALVILHGLFGSARNWHGIATRLAARQRVVSVDLRNHGRSPRAPDMDYAAMAGDVLALIEQLGLARPLLAGHSMGGKVAMTLALQAPARLAALVVVDIAPITYPDRFSPLVDAMRALDLEHLGTRAEAERALAARVPEAALRAFLLHNLARDGRGRWHWRVNLDAVQAALPALLGFPALEPGCRYPGPALLIRGAASNAAAPAHEQGMRARFPRLTVRTVEGAGHWPHAERPDAFLACLTPFLASVARQASPAPRAGAGP